VSAGEQCDDGNTISGDGCSGVCQKETDCSAVIRGCATCAYDQSTVKCKTCDSGYFVTPAFECKLIVCGDNIVSTGEQCDDGNTISGDGCSWTCQTEAACSTVISHCTTCAYNKSSVKCSTCNANYYVTSAFICKLIVCGDGIVSTGE
jgi:cysteine-rich repeat protein